MVFVGLQISRLTSPFVWKWLNGDLSARKLVTIKWANVDETPSIVPRKYCSNESHFPSQHLITQDHVYLCEKDTQCYVEKECHCKGQQTCAPVPAPSLNRLVALRKPLLPLSARFFFFKNRGLLETSPPSLLCFVVLCVAQIMSLTTSKWQQRLVTCISNQNATLMAKTKTEE